MSYKRNDLMELISMQTFMELDSFVKTMESMFEIDLNHESMRHQAQLWIKQLFKQTPVVSSTVRFPDKYHVNLSAGKIASLVRKLIIFMASLDEEGKDIIAFYEILDDIRKHTFVLNAEALKEAGIYTRSTFERNYGFSWNE